MAGGWTMKKSQNSLNAYHAKCFARCSEVAYVFYSLVASYAVGIPISI